MVLVSGGAQPVTVDVGVNNPAFDGNSQAEYNCNTTSDTKTDAYLNTRL